ncbi:vWA domain-containing protein, partial [Imhoffiella purpurea]|uniref:vWA domain-containing protein n=1 Tax=Imhoffiella purpurea TaxID=1249627 RepID=UPI0005C16316
MAEASTPDPAAIETKLAAARTRLILDKPFLGALVLRLPLQPAAAHWCPTTATDARTFYFNPGYIDSLSLEQTQFILAHEALHCALSHFARRSHRVKRRWDLACDHAINPLLIEDGLTPPPSALVQPRFKGLTAEEIYPLIEEEDGSETLDQHLYDREESSKGNRPNPDHSESDGTQKPNRNDPDPNQGGSGERASATDGNGSGAPEPRPLSASA